MKFIGPHAVTNQIVPRGQMRWQPSFIREQKGSDDNLLSRLVTGDCIIKLKKSMRILLQDVRSERLILSKGVKVATLTFFIQYEYDYSYATCDY
jgi:hypothetical protein